MGEDHRPGPHPPPAPSRLARTPELWVVIEVPEPVRSEVLMVRRIVNRTGQSVPVGIGSVGPAPSPRTSPRSVVSSMSWARRPAPSSGASSGLRRFPQTRYVYLAPDDEMATSL